MIIGRIPTDNSVKQSDGSINASATAHTSEPSTLSIIALVFGSVAIVLAIVAGLIALWEIREAKQVQIQLMYLNSIMLRDGLIQPGDMVFGPEGNLEYKQFKFEKPKGK